jgi:hypothetical protein
MRINGPLYLLSNFTRGRGARVFAVYTLDQRADLIGAANGLGASPA